MTTANSTETSAKKSVLKLQRAIVDGLEDVKAQDIQVFNTEHLSPLFERVIVASGTSNRQTKALASSVRDAVRDAGFAKPRTEGEDNGEWIIVDCGSVVAHIMQPAIRQYYHLEDIWGDTPVRLKLGAPKPATKDEDAPAAKKSVAKKAVAKKAATTSAAPKAAAGRAAAGTTPKAVPARKAAASAPRPPPARKTTAAASPTPAGKTAATGTAARKTAGSTGRAPVVKVAAKTLVVGKPVAKKAAAKGAADRKSTVRKPAAKKPSAKKPAAKSVPRRS